MRVLRCLGLLAFAAATVGASELRVAIAPARDPAGQLWRIEVRAVDSDRVLGEYGTAPDGTWSQRGLPLGARVHVVIKTDAGQPWWRSPEPIVLERDVLEKSISLSVVSVAGKLTWGGGPVPAQVRFRDSRIGTSVTTRAATDGTFATELPRVGTWTIGVTAARPAIRAEVRADVVQDRDGFARVVVALPGDGLVGEVVDVDGKTLPGASVTASCLCGGEREHTTTDADGVFKFDRLVTGTYVVAAGQRALTSEGVDVPFDVRNGAPFTTLVVRPRTVIRGRLLDVEGRPLRGGLRELVQEGAYFNVRSVAIGLDGRFVLEVPSSVERRCMVLGNRDLPQDVVSLERRDDEQVITADAVGGTLVLQDSPDGEDGRTVVVRNGCWVPPPLFEIGRKPGPRLVMLAAPGAWTLCRGSRGALGAFRGDMQSLTRCVTAVVSPGGTAVAALPPDGQSPQGQ